MNLRSPHWEWLLVDVANILAIAILWGVLTGRQPWWLVALAMIFVGLRVRVWSRRRREWKEAP